MHLPALSPCPCRCPCCTVPVRQPLWPRALMSAPAVVGICAGTVQALRAELERIGAGGGRDWSHVTTQIGMFAFTGLSARQARGPAAAPCGNRSLASQLAPGAGGACATYGPIGPRALPTSTLQQSCTLPCETTMPPCQGDRVGCGVPCLGLPALGDECSDGVLVPKCERCAVAVADPRCGRVAEFRLLRFGDFSHRSKACERSSTSI